MRNTKMPFRPSPPNRKNIRGVINPLTEAVRRLFGARQDDGAYPLGAFFPVDVSKSAWVDAGGIWYIPLSEVKLNRRNPKEEVVLAFINSIETGEPVELPGGKVVTWDRIPDPEADALP